MCYSFNVASSSSFADMIEESMSFRQQNSLESCKVPGRNKISGQFLDDAYESVQASIRPLFASAAKLGPTITSDGWSDVQRRRILNFMNLKDCRYPGKVSFFTFTPRGHPVGSGRAGPVGRFRDGGGGAEAPISTPPRHEARVHASARLRHPTRPPSHRPWACPSQRREGAACGSGSAGEGSQGGCGARTPPRP